MRILVVSNFYPPARPGGYTQWCFEIATRLAERGHTINVLTSRHEIDKMPDKEAGIHRWLHLDGDLFYYRPWDFFANWSSNNRKNLDYLRESIRQFDPEIIFIWGMWALSKAIPAELERLAPDRVVYFLSDYWPAAESMHETYWQRPAQKSLLRYPRGILSGLAKRMMARSPQAPLAFRHAICVSAAVKQILLKAGVAVENAEVIHGGTDLERFDNLRPREFDSGKLELLYAGQLVQHKGVHTAVEAMNLLVNQRGIQGIRLTILGSGHPEYMAALKRSIADQNLEDYVQFRDPVSREEMAGLLEQYDVLVFPSIYEEPLARMTQEAMAAGMVVVGTTTGGTKEILTEGGNGLTFPAEDAETLAKQIERLLNNPELCTRLAQAGRKSVLTHFNLSRMTADIEAFLDRVYARADSSKARSIVNEQAGLVRPK